MSADLIYLMGPSGAGKDSLLGWLHTHLPPHMPLHWARRTITRAARAGGEQHEAVDEAHFAWLQEQRLFALDWRANGLAYGIRSDELAPLHEGRRVLVNGSRAYLDEALRRFPRMTVVHVTAAAHTLRARLIARGRETPEQIAQRVHRATAFAPPPGSWQIHNDHSLEDAGRQLLAALQGSVR